MKVLIVDDDISRLSSLRNYLLDANPLLANGLYEACSVEDAVKLLQEFCFDVMILDVVLPRHSGPLEKADSKHGLDLLHRIKRDRDLLKPSKIVGITAHLHDLGRFKGAFEEYCAVVVEANRKSAGWKKTVAEYIGYDELSSAQRHVIGRGLNVVTLHGIRTYGEWQNRLESLVNNTLMPLPFHSYRYGYASFFAIFSARRRVVEVEKLRGYLEALLSGTQDAQFIIFAHSFGTYLVVEALRKLSIAGLRLNVDTVVLAGSVLRNDVDLTFLTSQKTRVVNDCADGDYVLWLSEAFIPGLGMAGKTGIYGFEGRYLLNRFSLGGHSSYFDGNEYMQSNWLPLLRSRSLVNRFDLRESSPLIQDFFERAVAVIAAFKRRHFE